MGGRYISYKYIFFIFHIKTTVQNYIILCIFTYFMIKMTILFELIL